MEGGIDMENIFEKPILDQMYEFRKEDFELVIYNDQDEIKKIEEEVCDIGDEMLEFLKSVISDKEIHKKALEFLRRYELAFSKEIDYWSKCYYKLGINDMYKLKSELKGGTDTIKKGDTFLDYTDGELDEYIQSKINFNSETYKAYKAKCSELELNYPRVLKVFEDSIPIVLNEEEMKKLMEIKELDMKVRSEEVKVCFKAGMNEILNF